METYFTFAQMFKYLKHRSKFKTVSELADALADEDLIYENSIFFHWQKGSRVPKNRKTLIKLIALFLKKGGLKNIAEANFFLECCDQGFINNKEMKFFNNYSYGEISKLWIEEITSFISYKKSKDIKTKNKKAKLDQKFNFYLNKKFLDKIGEIAKNKNISKSNLIRKMIATYVQGSLKG